jgi:hypothetical protein
VYRISGVDTRGVHFKYSLITLEYFIEVDQIWNIIANIGVFMNN